MSEDTQNLIIILVIPCVLLALAVFTLGSLIHGG
jgi:hypothetical protein